jgi:predicted permease
MACGIMTLAIGAGTVTFSVVDHVVLRPLPVSRDDRLVVIQRVATRSPAPGPVAPQDFFLWQKEASSFAAMGALAGRTTLQLPTDNGTAQLVTYRATTSLFDVLGVRPALGTGFTDSHQLVGRDRVVIISDAAWRSHFARDPEIVGRIVLFGQQQREIVGVMPRGFAWPVGSEEPAAAWIPFVPRPSDHDPASPGRNLSMDVVARLKDGVSLDHARGDIGRLTTSVAIPATQEAWRNARVVVVSARDRVLGPAKGWMLLVLAAVLMVILIACANVANLLLVRGTVRSHELAIQAALGASRARLVRTLICESLLLTGLATAAALVLANWGVEIARAHLPPGIPRAAAIALDARVLSATIGVALVTSVMFATVPAWRASDTNAAGLLNASTLRITDGRRLARWRTSLVVAEIAFVVTAVFATTLVVSSFRRVVSTEMGLAYTNRVAFMIPSPSLESLSAKERSQAVVAHANEALDRV